MKYGSLHHNGFGLENPKAKVHNIIGVVKSYVHNSDVIWFARPLYSDLSKNTVTNARLEPSLTWDISTIIITK